MLYNWCTFNNRYNYNCSRVCTDIVEREGMNTKSITIAKTRSQRRRARRKMQRMWASSGDSALRRNSRGRPEVNASGSAPSAKLVGRVAPIQQQDDAPSTRSLPCEFYTPSAEVFIHPTEFVEKPNNQVDRYLYLTKAFLSKVRRGVITTSSPIPLMNITIPVRTDNFPPLPHLVFGQPTGSNVVLFDQ